MAIRGFSSPQKLHPAPLSHQKSNSKKSPQRGNYFPPVVAIPSMNVRCARKNRISVGKQTSVDAAISNCHGVPPIRL